MDRTLRLAGALALALSLVGLAQPAVAASGFSVEPAAVRLAVDPGAETTVQLSLHNSFDRSMTVQLRVDVVTSQAADGTLAVRAATPADDQLPYRLLLDSSVVSLPAGGSTETSVHLRTSSTTPPGSYVRMIQLDVATDQAGAGIGSVTSPVSTTVSLPFFFDVNGEATLSAAVTDVVASPALSRGRPIVFSALMQNTGGLAASVAGTVTLFDRQNRPVGRSVVPRILVLPAASRTLTSTWQPTVHPGQYRAHLNLQLSSANAVRPLRYVDSDTTVTIGLTVESLTYRALGVGGILVGLVLVVVRRRSPRPRRGQRASQ